MDARIIVAKGLKPANGANDTKEALTISLILPSPYSLTIQNIESEHDGTEGIVRVNTSQQPGADNIKQFIKFEPEVTYTVEPSENGFALRSDKFDIEKSYSLTIKKDLRGRIGGILKEDFYGSVAFGELESAISFTNSKANPFSEGSTV